jgi:hypothetical protein
MPGKIAHIPIGASLEGRDLILHANFPAGDGDALARGGTGTLLIGGTHGDERATVAILDAFVLSRLATGMVAEPVGVRSLHNPDGHAADSRYNARGVDLNRNFPHRWSPQSEEPAGDGPLSEPEAKALHDLIVSRRPAKIISLHWALSEIDADGPQRTALAARMWETLSVEERRPYRLSVHRPEAPAADVAGAGFCPGSLGQWCGNHLAYPDGTRPAMVTLELPYHPHAIARPDPLPSRHLQDVRELWRDRPEAYLAGVEGPVLRMLEAACRLPHAWPRRDGAP